VASKGRVFACIRYEQRSRMSEQQHAHRVGASLSSELYSSMSLSCALFEVSESSLSEAESYSSLIKSFCCNVLQRWSSVGAELQYPHA